MLYGEVISMAAAGPGGVILVTNKRGILFTASLTVKILNFEHAGFTPTDVDRVKMQGVPVLTLYNGSLVTFGSYQQSHACVA